MARDAERQVNRPRRQGGAFAARQRRDPNMTWPQRIGGNSPALDLDPDVLALRNPRRIARSLKRSAERRDPRQAGLVQAALEVLTCYLDRAGQTLPVERRQVLQRAKDELRQVFGKKR
jgi:hypothetical protein